MKQNIKSVIVLTSICLVVALLLAVTNNFTKDKIAENIQSIRDQAKYLQQEAKEIINNAKQKIEQMILGK